MEHETGTVTRSLGFTPGVASHGASVRVSPVRGAQSWLDHGSVRTVQTRHQANRFDPQLGSGQGSSTRRNASVFACVPQKGAARLPPLPAVD